MSAIAFLVNESFRHAQNALDPALRAIHDYQAALAALAELTDATPEVRAWAAQKADELRDVWVYLDAIRFSWPPKSDDSQGAT